MKRMKTRIRKRRWVRRRIGGRGRIRIHKVGEKAEEEENMDKRTKLKTEKTLLTATGMKCWWLNFSWPQQIKASGP